LGSIPLSIQNRIYSGSLPAERIANRWLTQRDKLTEFAKTYNPQKGRLRIKKKYIKRSLIWQQHQEESL